MSKKKETKVTRDNQITALLNSGMVREVLSFENKKYNDADVILLNDGKTFIELREQDYISYHDCSTSARHVEIRQDEEAWNNYLKMYYPAHYLT